MMGELIVLDLMYEPHQPIRRIEPLSDNEDRYAGYRKLWTHVITRAIHDIVADGVIAPSPGRSKKHSLNAQRWVFAPPRNEIQSFDWVCHYVGVSPDRIRSWLKNLSRKEKRKLVHNLRHVDKGVRNVDLTSTQLPGE